MGEGASGVWGAGVVRVRTAAASARQVGEWETGVWHLLGAQGECARVGAPERGRACPEGRVAPQNGVGGCQG